MERELGCRIQPLDGVKRITPLLGAGTLPEEYIIPPFRHLFDANFVEIPAEAEKFIKEQNGYPSCCGQSASYCKEATEGVAMSGNDAYKQCKHGLDGTTDPLSWGTTIAAAQEAVKRGICEYRLAPEGAINLQAYVNNPATPEQLANRQLHKGKDFFGVTRDQFRQTIFQFGLPIQTSLAWYSSDDQIGPNGIMGFPSGLSRGGHSVTMIGWTKKGDVHANSFGPHWGAHGFFYAPSNIRARFSSGMVAIDLPPALPEILAKYDLQNVKVMGGPKVYRIVNGKKRLFPDQETFWSLRFLFSQVVDISKSDLDLIPEGPNMSINDATYEGRELVREIRASVGLL